jgi:hypothetical protein
MSIRGNEHLIAAVFHDELQGVGYPTVILNNQNLNPLYRFIQRLARL